MFHQTLAAEQKDKATFRVLNYAPGPLDTDMQREIREGPNVDPTTQASYTFVTLEDTSHWRVQGVRPLTPTSPPARAQATFVAMKADNQLVDVNDSALKLVRLVWQEKYASGAHVDYFDRVPGMCNDVKCTCGALCGCGSECTCETGSAKAEGALAPAAAAAPAAAGGSCCGSSASAEGASSCGCTPGNCSCCMGCKTGGACVCTPGNCNCCGKCTAKVEAQANLDAAAVAALRRNAPKAIESEGKPKKDDKKEDKKAAKTEEKPAKDDKKASKAEDKPKKENKKEDKKPAKADEKPAKEDKKTSKAEKPAKTEDKKKRVQKNH